MEDHRVPCLFGICWSGLGSEQDFEIGVEEDEPDKDQEDDEGGVPLLFEIRLSEDSVPKTEDPGKEETQGLRPKRHKEIWKDGEPAHQPNQANDQEGLLHRADLGMAERKADGDVAFQRHCR